VSFWPNALSTDATASKGVRSHITVVSWAITLTTVFVSIAAIVTPLGLYETVRQSNTPSLVPFHYVKDASPFGSGTAERPSLGFSRICIFGERACPNDMNKVYNVSYINVTLVDGTNATRRIDNMTTYDTRIPRRLLEYFSSGLPRLGRTVSGPFDIQWRTWKTTIINDPHSYYDNNTAFIRGDYRHISSLILDNALEAVEGLIVDSKSGGIGFRNHSVPAPDLLNGAVWTEDLLFIEPVTKCSSMDLALEYTLVIPFVYNYTIVDHGGFVNVNKSTPYWEGTDDQQDPRLFDRAYMAAWKTKMLTMFLYNITNTRTGPDKLTKPPFSYLNSQIGDKLNLPDPLGGTVGGISYNSLSTQALYGDWLKDALDAYQLNATLGDQLDPGPPPNPWNVTYADYLNISKLLGI
jgi:hypothetical protein